MNKNNKNFITLAKVTKPHGIRGESELYLINSNYEESVLEDGMTVYLFPLSEKSQISHHGEEWVIDKIRFGNKVICQFEGIKDRNHLETLLPFELKLSRDSFPEVDEGEVYLVDLIDWEVVNLEGDKIGVLESFSDNGQQYLFDVRLSDGPKISLPYVEVFFPKIDTELKQITMVMPDYTE